MIASEIIKIQGSGNTNSGTVWMTHCDVHLDPPLVTHTHSQGADSKQEITWRIAMHLEKGRLEVIILLGE